LERRKEKERAKEEKEREKEREKEEKQREKEEKERAKKDRNSVKFERDVRDDLPDDQLMYELDEVIFKDGKERIKLKNKGASLPSSLRKSKSFLRALAQKWTLSSKPPSYPPPHVPSSETSAPEDFSSSSSDSD